MLHLSYEDKTIIVACYAQALSLGHTLLCKTIRSSTIVAYLSAVSAFFASHPAGLRDPTAVPHGRGRPALLAKVIAEHRRWESMPNRRETVTKAMLYWIQNEARASSPHSCLSALADW